MITSVVRYVTWPRDVVRTYTQDDWDDSQYGVTLGMDSTDQTLIPWVNVIDIVTHNTNRQGLTWPKA